VQLLVTGSVYAGDERRFVTLGIEDGQKIADPANPE
jgi:hypothetical protein